MDAVVDLPLPPSSGSAKPSRAAEASRPRLVETQDKPVRSRKVLYAGTAAVVVLAGIGVYLAGSSHHPAQHHRIVTSAPAVVAHATQPTAVARPAPSAPPTHATDTTKAASPAPAKDTAATERAELLALRGDAKPAAEGTPAKSEPLPASPARPALAAVPVLPAAAVTTPAMASAAPTHDVAAPQTAGASEVGSSSRPASSDPVDRAAHLEAAPMSTPEQVQVLNLVTELAVLVKNQRQQLDQLRTDEAGMHKTLETSLGDYGRRISLAEASAGVASARVTAQGAVADAAAPPAPTIAPAVPPAPAGSQAGPHHYRVQAASPRLAMLADQDTGTQVAVAPGDDLAGYGKVTAIAQYGTHWQITTDHGSVR